MSRRIRGQLQLMSKEERAKRAARNAAKPSGKNRVGRLWARKHLEGR